MWHPDRWSPYPRYSVVVNHMFELISGAYNRLVDALDDKN